LIVDSLHIEEHGTDSTQSQTTKASARLPLIFIRRKRNVRHIPFAFDMAAGSNATITAPRAINLLQYLPRRIAHVVGFGLKRQAEHCHALSCEFTATSFSILGIIDPRNSIDFNDRINDASR